MHVLKMFYAMLATTIYGAVFAFSEYCGGFASLLPFPVQLPTILASNKIHRTA